MKKILVTGATGFIGNYVIEQLLLNNNCHVIATSSNSQKAQLTSWYNKVDYLPFNLKEFDNNVNYFEFFNQPDLLIHLAWEGLPNYKADFHINENLPRHFIFIKNLIDHGLKDITVTGTCFEYGMQEGELSELIEPKPTNSYSIAKDTLRKKIAHLQLLDNINFKWVRLFYMYGSGQSPNSLLSQLDRSLSMNEPIFNMSGGEQERDYLPVEEVAANIINIALQQTVTGIINCCSGNPIKVKDFVINYLQTKNKYIELNLGYYPYVDYEPMSFWGNNKKLKTILNNE